MSFDDILVKIKGVMHPSNMKNLAGDNRSEDTYQVKPSMGQVEPSMDQVEPMLGPGRAEHAPGRVEHGPGRAEHGPGRAYAWAR